MMNLEPELNAWICTDDSGPQYCKRLSEMEFSFIELYESPYRDGGYLVYHDVIDLGTYTLAELQDICHAFYGPSDDPIREIINEYGTIDAMQIIAECVFESSQLYGSMDFCAQRSTYEAAKQFMEDWMREADKE